MENIRLYYHICSDGNYADVLFRNEQDFKAAMNRIAVCTLKRPVVLLAFVLMGNHFHFVGRFCSEDDCYGFANDFKRLTGKYNSDIYHEKASLGRLLVKAIPVTDETQLRTLIGYVVKNPTKARLGMFYSYRWGTGSLYFREEDERMHNDSVTVSCLGARSRRQICRTRVSLPLGWIIKEGIILPENYVAVKEVELLYKTTRSYMYFLSMNKDDEIERDLGEWNELRLSDAEMRIARSKMSMEMFGTDNIRDLSAPLRLKIAKAMRAKYLCSKKQIARIVLLPYDVVEKALG